MAYTPISPQRIIQINALFSVHYFEYTSSYAFPGESHNFWEFVYVDKGTVRIVAGDQEYTLSRGQIIFHPPGEFHALSADGVAAPNLIVVSFDCSSPAMEFFRKRLTFAGSAERVLLARLVEESQIAFSSPLNDPSVNTLQRRPDAPTGSEQLLVSALEEFLIYLLRQGDSLPKPSALTSEALSDNLQSVINYLEQRLDQPLTVSQICRDNMIGRSQLQKLFHQQTGHGVMDYFNRMKIKAAQQMVREGRLNFTQISQCLGFQSVHYFSRRFKALTGMSPSEYADSVKMLTERPKPRMDDCTNNV